MTTTQPTPATSSTTVDLSLTIPNPGEIPGLLRYAAPLVTLVSSRWRSTCPDCGRVEEGRKPEHRPVLCVGADKFSTYVADGTDDPKGSPWSHSHLALRLDIEPGRACAAWWLAQTVPELKGRGTGATFEFYSLSSAYPDIFGWALRLAGRGVGAASMMVFSDTVYRWERWKSFIVPAPVLSGLDANDPRTLADGSRWVDAEALRRLVLSAAGRDAST